MKPSVKKIVQITGIAIIATAVFIVGVISYVRFSNLDKIYNSESVPTADAIIVLGASLKPNGDPSDALMDRLLVGAELFQLDKAPIIIVTGDDGQNRTNEVSAMRQKLIELGIPDNAIMVDNHGYRTYESCKRADQVFNIDNAILVTQKFHLVRALYICNNLDVNSVGVTSDLQSYQKINQFIIRDWLASFKAWIDINIWEPKSPIYIGKS